MVRLQPERLSGQSLAILKGIGATYQARLRSAHITTLGQLAAMDLDSDRETIERLTLSASTLATWRDRAALVSAPWPDAPWLLPGQLDLRRYSRMTHAELGNALACPPSQCTQLQHYLGLLALCLDVRWLASTPLSALCST